MIGILHHKMRNSEVHKVIGMQIYQLQQSWFIQEKNSIQPISQTVITWGLEPSSVWVISQKTESGDVMKMKMLMMLMLLMMMMMSMNVNECQWMSMNVNECQWMSMNVNECQGGIWSSLFSERAKPSRISPNRFLDISTDVMKMLLASVI